MNRYAFILGLVAGYFVSIGCKAQAIVASSAFADLGTQWNFVNPTQQSAVPNYQFSASSDTLIAGIKAIIVKCTGQDSTGTFFPWGSEIMYGDSNKVYCYINNSFKCVYDFSEPVGHIHTVTDSSFKGFFQFQSLSHKFRKFSYKIAAKDTQIVHGKPRRTLLLEPVAGAEWTFGLNHSGNNRVIEGLGCNSSWTIIGSPRNIISLNRQPLICLPESGQHCDTITGEPNGNLIEPLQLSIYPNPVQDRVVVTGTAKFENLSLYDSFGRRLAIPPVSANGLADFTNLASGYYLLLDHSNPQRVSKTRFIKQ